MVIKNKDGSVYILHGPNPLVKDQDFWKTADLVFHNFEWEEIIYSKSIQKSTDNKHKKTETLAETNSSTTTVEKINSGKTNKEDKNIEEEKFENSAEEEKSAYEMPLIKHKVLAYCLPALLKNYSDTFYGESWSKIKYGKKFIFPCVMIENQDLFIKFWTSDPNKQITENSIVYPFSYEIYNSNSNTYDRVPYDEYRWWEISSKESKNGGWLFEAIPSKNQPDFSD